VARKITNLSNDRRRRRPIISAAAFRWCFVALFGDENLE
jgi:hypothetical protein